MKQRTPEVYDVHAYLGPDRGIGPKVGIASVSEGNDIFVTLDSLPINGRFVLKPRPR